MSGPSPVGTCATKSLPMSPDAFCTSSTSMPVSSVNVATTGSISSMRVSSTHIVRVPVAPALSVGRRRVVARAEPEHAVNASARPIVAATTGMLRRIVISKVGCVPRGGTPPTLA